MISIEKYKRSGIFRNTEFDKAAAIITTSRLNEHPIHFHDCLEIVFVIKGSIVVKSSCRYFTLNEGEFILINAYEFHSLRRISDEAAIAYIHTKQVSGAEDPLLVYDIDVLKNDSELYHKIRKNITDIITASEKSDEGISVLDDCVQDVLTTLYSNVRYAMYAVNGKRNPYEDNELYITRLNDMLDYMYMHYDEHLTLTDISLKFNLSKYYLSHVLKKGYNESFTGLLNLVRVDRSELAILDTELPVGEISLDMGFSSQQYFTKCFKEYFGLTPLQYRKRYKKETVKYKNIDEEKCEISEFFPEESKNSKYVHDKESGLHIKLGKYDCKVGILREWEDDMKADILEIKDNESVSLDFDCDKLVITIRKAHKNNIR